MFLFFLLNRCLFLHKSLFLTAQIGDFNRRFARLMALREDTFNGREQREKYFWKKKNIKSNESQMQRAEKYLHGEFG